jgi:cytochrome c-type biogenesis protein
MASFALAALGACDRSRAGEGGSSTPRSGPVAVGADAPTYAIQTLAGDSLTVGPSDNLVLLNVWATWCASCKEEFAFMDTLLAKHRSKGLRVVAVSVDVGSSEPVQQVASQYNVTFEVAHDPEGTIERRFPAMGVPASYLIDRDGKLLWKHVGVLPPSVDAVIEDALEASPASAAEQKADEYPHEEVLEGPGGEVYGATPASRAPLVVKRVS